MPKIQWPRLTHYCKARAHEKCWEPGRVGKNVAYMNTQHAGIDGENVVLIDID